MTKRHARRAANSHALTAAGFDEVTPLLAWPGVALPEMTLLNSRVIPVVDLDLDAHQARADSGDGPELDSATLTMWEWPESAAHAPGPALSLSGLLCSDGGRWRPALTEAVRWRGFGPTAVLTSGAGLDTEPVPADGLAEFAVHGVGLVAADRAGEDAETVRLIVAPQPGRRARAARRRTADRWVEEVLYQQALDLGLYASTGPRP